MAVKVGKVLRKNNFFKLSNNAKLIYIYLATDPNISCVGVLSLNIDVAIIHLNLTLDGFRGGCEELVELSLLSVDRFEGEVYFTVVDHFNTIPKSDNAVIKITKELQKLPAGLVKKLNSLNINVSRKVVTFTEPSPKEVMDYSLSQGYQIDADAFIGYYRGKAKDSGKGGLWLDGRGKQVKDWKAKLRGVWFKDENKLKTVIGAPKGFESFYINFEGKQIFPEQWRGGLPYSKNIVVDKALKRGYNDLL